jgi:pimeloyl-ACP methyl ester carboxylesterase
MTCMINYYRAMLRGSQIADEMMKKPNITVPTLILWGEKDIFGVTEMAEFSYRYCPQGSKLVILPNATHWITTEEPERVNKEILDFV